MSLIGIILGALLGVGGMYLLDPEMGKRRRALLRDQMTKARHSVSDAAEVASEQISDRAQGAVAEAKTRLQPQPVSDMTLVARVRSELGRATGHPGAIEVTATNSVVALSGHALASDLERILSTVRNVPGVQNVENRLMVHDTPDGIPSLQGSGERETRSFGGGGSFS